MERDTQDPLEVVESDCKTRYVLIDGFKRYRCARKLSKLIIPVRCIAPDVTGVLVSFLRRSIHKGVSTIEEAAVVEELHKRCGMSIYDIAHHTGRSPAWVSMRLNMLDGISDVIRRKIISGAFPARAVCTGLRGSRAWIADDGVKNQTFVPPGYKRTPRCVPKNRKLGCEMEESRLRETGEPFVRYLDQARVPSNGVRQYPAFMELYDSMRFIEESQVLCFIGPTGCGKTGLATSYLIHAKDSEYRGRFFDFKDLLRHLNASFADHSYRSSLKHLASLDCLLLDEVGYAPLDKTQAGIFFELIKARHKKHCTIITSQLGFNEWESFIGDRHLTAAILDRITENCTVFNMSKCISIRRKRITYATEKATA